MLAGDAHAHPPEMAKLKPLLDPKLDKLTERRMALVRELL